MPRLNFTTYCHIHDQLHRFWLGNNQLFAELTIAEQWHLHDYFQLTKDWPKSELLSHRRTISTERPDLPAKAGRAYAKFRAHAASWAMDIRRAQPHAERLLHVRPKPAHHAVRVTATVKPFDADKLAQVIWLMANQQLDAGSDEPLAS